MKVYIISFIIIVLCLTLIQASITCNPSSILVTYKKGEIISAKTTQCSNNNTNVSSSISKSGNHFTIDQSIIGIGPSTKTINLFFEPNASVGVNSGSINFGDGSPAIPVTATITEPDEIDGCRLIELPHTVNYRIKQGEKGASNQIRIKVSNECTEPLAMSVIEEVQMNKPMSLQGQSGDIDPGGEFAFTIVLDATGVQTGTYQNSYTVAGTTGDKIYKKTIFLSTVVTISDNPVTNSTFSTLPVCTLDSDLQLNTTYSLVCNNENPNLAVEVLYNNFFKGVSVSESEGKFEYKFQPMSIGTTNFTALFKYKDVPIGTPFTKEVRITQGSTPISGTLLNVLFYQLDVRKAMSVLSTGLTRLLVVDNKTDTAVSSYKLLLNGIEINNTIIIEPEKAYDLRVSSTGYSDLVLLFSVNQSPLYFQIIPEKSVYTVGESITLNSSFNDTKYLANDVIINNPYSLPSKGNYTFKSVKEGYITINKTITVIEMVTYQTATPQIDEWAKGEEVFMKLNRNASWEVQKDGVKITSGEGEMIEFELEGYGNWAVVADGSIIAEKLLVREFSIFNPFSWWDKIKTLSWYYLLAIVGLLTFGGWFFIFKKNGNDLNKTSPYA